MGGLRLTEPGVPEAEHPGDRLEINSHRIARPVVDDPVYLHPSQTGEQRNTAASVSAGSTPLSVSEGYRYKEGCYRSNGFLDD